MTDPHSPVCSIRTGSDCDCEGHVPWPDLPEPSAIKRARRFRRLEGKFETGIIIACVFILGFVGGAIATVVMQ